ASKNYVAALHFQALTPTGKLLLLSGLPAVAKPPPSNHSLAAAGYFEFIFVELLRRLEHRRRRRRRRRSCLSVGAPRRQLPTPPDLPATPRADVAAAAAASNTAAFAPWWCPASPRRQQKPPLLRRPAPLTPRCGPDEAGAQQLARASGRRRAPSIRRGAAAAHCAAIKHLCTPWPKALDEPGVMISSCRCEWSLRITCASHHSIREFGLGGLTSASCLTGFRCATSLGSRQSLDRQSNANEFDGSSSQKKLAKLLTNRRLMLRRMAALERAHDSLRQYGRAVEFLLGIGKGGGGGGGGPVKKLDASSAQQAGQTKRTTERQAAHNL
uniref:REM-1 domain-containing protein n=1 Tax=Macrostomum lignano TaxID=282301 RepID=A0A1I8FN81_9PLAT